MSFENIAIIGAGAIGSFYGAKLQQSGKKVQFQTRSGAPVLKKQNMQIHSVWGNFYLKVDAHASTQTMNPSDLIIISTKALENIDYHAILSPVITEKSVIILIQNGINMDERLQELFPRQKVVGAAAFVCLNRNSAVDIQHFAYGSLDIGYLNPLDKSLTHEIVRLFKTAGVESNFSGYIRQIRWKKLLWNIPFNVLSVLLLKANTKEMIEDKNILQLSIELMKEVQKLADSEKIIITDNNIAKMIQNTKVMVPYKTSMLLDFEEHRPMEVEAILGEPLRIAQKIGIKVPHIEVLYAQLKFLDLNRRK